MKHLIILIISSLVLLSCGRNRTLYFYSLDKSQCITVFDRDTLRYVIDGKHNSVPETNYILLRTDKIPELGNSFHVCWDNGQYEWEVVVHKAIIVENRLDTTRFNFNAWLPEDDRGIPTEKKFRTENCAVFDFYNMKLSPDQGAIVEIK